MSNGPVSSVPGNGGDSGPRARPGLARSFVMLWMLLLVIATIGVGILLFANGSWRQHPTLGTDRVDGEVTAVDEVGTCPGRGDRDPPELEYEITYTKGGQKQTATIGGCKAEQRDEGDRIGAYVTDGGRTFDWPAWQFYTWVLVVTTLLAGVLAWLAGRADSSRRTPAR